MLMKHIGLSFGIFALYLGVVNCDESDTIYEGVPSLFFTDCLVSINKYRGQHGSLPLIWDVDLHYHAQAWADRLAAGDTVQNDIEALDKLKQGQTVGYISPAKRRCRIFPPTDDCYACRTTIDKWYNESQYYNYKTGYSRHRRRQVLHFTQLVWQDTEKVGIATAVSARYGVIIVARFYPRGNIGYLDDYIENVTPYGTEMVEETDGFEASGDKSGTASGPGCVTKKRKRSSGACFDTYPSRCVTYKMENEGYCEYARPFMKVYCRKTCGYCNEPLPLQETEEEKQLRLYWVVGTWSERCHGGFQRRSVRCLHKHGRRYEFVLENDVCETHVGKKPVEYKECDNDEL